jgi:hypothetical protein
MGNWFRFVDLLVCTKKPENFEMTPKQMTQLSVIVMVFDALGLVLAIALSLYLHGQIFDLLTWVLTLVPMIIVGTGVGVWQAMKALRG